MMMQQALLEELSLDQQQWIRKENLKYEQIGGCLQHPTCLKTCAIHIRLICAYTLCGALE